MAINLPINPVPKFFIITKLNSSSLSHYSLFPFPSLFSIISIICTMEEWSPQDAMEAYLHTLHLISKVQYCNKDDKPRVIEPKCMELISALAAGKGAKLIVEITTEGITPLTIALGVAAKQSGGQLICILASESDEYSNPMKTKLDQYRDVETVDLGDVVKLVHAGRRPCEVIMQLKNIDFAVIDSKFDDNYLKLMFKKLDANIIPTGSPVIVLHNLEAGPVSSFAQVVKRRRGVESVTIPIGEGIELTKILGSSISRQNRFHVTFHN